MKSQFELVNHLQLKHVKVIVNQIVHRSPHVHSDFEFAMLLKNDGILKTNDERYEMKPGDVVFINSYESHSYSSLKSEDKVSDDFKDAPIFLIVQVSYHFLVEYYPQIRNTVFQTCNLKEFFQEGELYLINQILLGVGRDYFLHEEYYQLRLITRLSYLLRMCLTNIPHKLISDEEKEEMKRQFDRTQRIISYIDENYSGKIRLEDIAKKEGITVTHLSHIFAESSGLNFQQYVNLKRLEKAILLMQDEHKTLTNIAFESGFSDPKYMNQLFKKYYNCKPRQYRNLYKKIRQDDESVLSVTQKEHLYSDALAYKEIEDYINSNNIKMGKVKY